AYRINREITLAPAVQTRFGARLVIVWEHIENVDLASKARLCCSRDFSRTNDLLASRKQRRAIEKCPAVKLYVSKFDSLGLERFGQLNYFWQTIDIAPVNHKIET